MNLDFSIDLLRRQLIAKEKWHAYQSEAQLYTRKEIKESLQNITELKVVINILIEKRKEFRRGNRTYILFSQQNPKA